MFPGNIDNLLQQFLRIKRSGRIIWIDDDNCFGLIRDFRADIVDIGIPFGFLITDIMHGGTASQIHTGGPQRIVRRRHQHFVAVVQQCGQRQIDELADAIASKDIIDGDVWNILELCILHDGFACREQTLGRRISFGLRELLCHIIHNFIRSPESEWRRIADIEFQNMRPRCFHARRFIRHRTTNVVEHIVELMGFRKGAHDLSFC